MGPLPSRLSVGAIVNCFRRPLLAFTCSYPYALRRGPWPVPSSLIMSFVRFPINRNIKCDASLRADATNPALSQCVFLR